MTDSQQWLAEYAEKGSETAFRAIVESYVNLVYSAALRLVDGDAHLAEDVTQVVFADLARHARKLSQNVMLGGWLHRHTCFVASNTMRRERRRQLRERQAVEMNALDDPTHPNLALLRPVLDEAINQLGAEDRAAILLRFFEQKDFHSVGEALGSSEEAARKRVQRALEKLQASLARRGVVLPAGALAATLATHAVAAAPAGLALAVSTAACAAAATTGSTITLLELMSMTKLKIGIATAAVAALVIPLALQHRAYRQLRDENAGLRAQLGQLEQLAAENQRLSNRLASTRTATASVPVPSTNEQYREMLKLRGEVGRLKSAAAAPAPSPLSGVISDPEVRTLIRNQQKAGMTVIYKDFTNRVKLPPEQSEKFVNLLADDIMENVDHVTALLRDGKSRDEIDRLFTEQEALLREKVKALLGPEGAAEYDEYSRNLVGHLTAEQFKAQMSGEPEAKEMKSKQLAQVMREETQAVLAAAGLPSDFQTMPILNFRNIASEQEAENNLKLLEQIFQRASTRANSFLSPDEVAKFAEFQNKAIQGNRMALTLNRKMMAPGAK